VLVEFNPNANDDFSGFERPAAIGSEECVTEPPGTLLNGPVHNQMPNPATAGRGTDNESFWVPDFSPSHYRKMIYTKTGLTQRVRPDLTGPDGRPGVDLRGYTVKNHYREMSKGAYDITGDVAGWVQVQHSEAWYGAARCGQAPRTTPATPTTPARSASWSWTRSTPWPPPSRTSPGPTTTSRTRATPTATATCSSPMGSSTTS